MNVCVVQPVVNDDAMEIENLGLVDRMDDNSNDDDPVVAI